MKKLLIALALSSATMLPTVAAEPPQTKVATETFYIQLVSRTRVTDHNATVNIEIGSELANLTGMSEGYAAAIRKRRFNSLLDALNKLAVNGWKLVATGQSQQGASIVTTWTLAKSVADRSELLDGLAD